MKIAILGHRLQDLGGFDDCELHTQIKGALEKIITSMKPDDVLLTSMSIGVEMWAAELASQHKINYHVYIPFKNFHARWPFGTRKIYSELLKKSSKKITISDGDFDVKFLKEKEVMMINDCDKLCGVFKDDNYLTRLAVKNGKQVEIVRLDEDNEWFIPF